LEELEDRRGMTLRVAIPGFTLIVEGLHQHIPKGYIYFAMGFSVFVEMLNLRIRDKDEGAPVKLRKTYSKKKNSSN